MPAITGKRGGVEEAERVFFGVVERQFASLDFDAEHPLYLHLVKQGKIGQRSAIWLSFLYMAFYDEASAWVTFKTTKPFSVPKILDLPIGTNRRNLYGGKIKDHFESAEQLVAKEKNWPTHNFTGDPVADWGILKDNLGQVWGNGRFGSYTTAEMLQKVCGVKVEVHEFANQGSSAPADGACRLARIDRKDKLGIDRATERAFELVIETGLTLPYTEVDRGVVESVLCNYSGICRGVFYSGRNLDRQQARINRVQALGHRLTELWEARGEVFNKEYLGEVAGWEGIDRPRLKAFRDRGELLWANEQR